MASQEQTRSGGEYARTALPQRQPGSQPFQIQVPVRVSRPAARRGAPPAPPSATSTTRAGALIRVVAEFRGTLGRIRDFCRMWPGAAASAHDFKVPFPADGDTVSALRWNPAGTMIAAGGWDCKVRGLLLADYCLRPFSASVCRRSVSGSLPKAHPAPLQLQLQN